MTGLKERSVATGVAGGLGVTDGTLWFPEDAGEDGGEGVSERVSEGVCEGICEGTPEGVVSEFIFLEI